MVFKNFKSPHVVRSYKRRSRASYCRTPIRTPTTTSKGKSANIKVCVRVRPPNSAEAVYGESRTVVRPLDDRVLVFDPRELQTQTFFKGKVIKDPTSRRNKDLKLAFDRVFDTDASNQDVFEHTTKDMLDHLLDGVNCSVFAYGATGAGKTYTMLGTSSAHGVIFRTMQHLYARIEAAKEDVICDVQVSYLEIYNETVRDLLNPESGILAVREDGDQGISVAGLTMHQPSSAEHLFQMLDFGNCNRTQHPTDANKESSRSHAVFQLHLKQSPKTADISSDVLLSKMALIDLAGSERATATTNSGERFREGANINKSLLALGNCINALAEGKKGAHIPYRDSKLTRILKDSLGGSCHTVMIANVSPSSLSYDDTYNTLKYADRAKHIKADLKKNVIRVDQHIHQYGKIVQQLRTEVDEWKTKFKESQRIVESLQQKLEHSAAIDRTCQLLSEVKTYLAKYTEMQTELLASQSQKRFIELKLTSRECAQTHLNVLQYDPERIEKETCRTERLRKQCQMRIEKLDATIGRIKLGLNDLKDDMQKCIKSLKVNPDDYFTTFALDAFSCETKTCQFNALYRHLCDALIFNEERLDSANGALNILCSLARQQHLILTSYDKLTPSLSLQYENAVKLLQGAKEISWADENSTKKASLSNFSDCVLNFSSDSSRPSSCSSVGSNASKSMFSSFQTASDMAMFSLSNILNDTIDLDEAFQTTPNGQYSMERFSKDCNENLSPAILSKPCRKTFVVENAVLSSSVSSSPSSISYSNGVFSPLREISNQSNLNETFSKYSQSTPPRLSTVSSVSKPKTAAIMDDDVFKKPVMPVPRKASTISASQRKNMEDVKRYGLPSFTENFVLNKRTIAPAASKASPLIKSPSFSNLRDKMGKTTHQLKKTFSTSNLRRS